MRRDREGSGSVREREEEEKKNLWGMRSRMMLTLSRLSGRPIAMSDALKSLSEVTKFQTQGLSSDERRTRERPFTA